MNPTIIITVIVIYFAMLVVVARLTSGKGDNETFFIGNRQSPWYIVAFGMIGASLSGVTFISVPGWVESSQFSYMQIVLGYLVGYIVIATVLLPLYYRLQLTSIYTYLDQRFGKASYKTGASFFLLSRIIGASFRLYLVAIVLEFSVFEPLGYDVPFFAIVAITIALIWVYTFRGGIKTIIWTDTLQTIFMLLAVAITIVAITKELNWSFEETLHQIDQSDYSQWFYWEDWSDKKHFIKQFISGALIAIAMTGLDQDMMQKNLSCRNLKDAQKNMISFSLVLIVINFVFLSLGALLYFYANQKGMAIPDQADKLFPMIALSPEMGVVVGICFILGLIAAAYSSADSALTALTTSFYIDILGKEESDQKKQYALRKKIHLGMSLALLLVIVSFKALGDDSIISTLFKFAGYTYGPLLGLYAFGLFTNLKLQDRVVPFVCILAPILTWLLDYLLKTYLQWDLGFMILAVNGALTFIGLWFISYLGKSREHLLDAV